MKFIPKLPKENLQKIAQLLESGWKPLKEPSSIGVSTLLSFPLALMLIIVNFLWCYQFYPPLQNFFQNKGNFMLQFNINVQSLFYLLGIFLLLLLHEAIHAAFVPNVLYSDKTFLGMNLFFAFIYTEESLTKNRFLLICIMPFLLISFAAPPVLSSLGLLNGFTIFLSILNAGSSCIDVLNLILVATQVPSGGMVVNNGLRTFYIGKKVS